MRVFNVSLKKSFPGKRISFFRRGKMAAVVPPNHYGGAIVYGTPEGHDSIFVDMGTHILKIEKPHRPDEKSASIILDI